MEKLLLEAIYELTQSVQILALKVDELDKNTTILNEYQMDVKNLSNRLKSVVEKMEQNEAS
ncbi:MAG: hypothetical protein WC716_14260 [Chitinophagaceae bacterium]|jgi:hypothetical protein